MALKQAMTPEFRLYQRQVLANCRALAETLMALGYKVVTGTTGTEPVPALSGCGCRVVAWARWPQPWGDSGSPQLCIHDLVQTSR